MTEEGENRSKSRRGRPPKPLPKIDGTPEQIASAMFSAVKPPDPSRRIAKTKLSKKSHRDCNGST